MMDPMKTFAFLCFLAVVMVLLGGLNNNDEPPTFAC